MPNVLTPLERTVDTLPEVPAVTDGTTRLSFEAFWDRTGRIGGGLASRGVEPGDRVALHLPNTIAYVCCLYGALRAGAVVVPINPQCRERELHHHLADSGATLVVTRAKDASLAASLRDESAVKTVVSAGEHPDFETVKSLLESTPRNPISRDEGDLAFLPYTSGTTGRPKGVELTHANVSSNAEQTAALPEGGLTTDDRMLAAVPLTHIYGLSAVVHATLISGATLHLQEHWEPRAALRTIEEEGVTTFHGVPTMFADFVGAADADEFETSSLRFVGTGGAAMPGSLLTSVEDLLDVPVYEGYGLTETAPVTHFNRPDAHRRGSVGRALSGVAWRVVGDEFEERPPVETGPVAPDSVAEHVGEVVVAGPTVMAGYHGMPEATAAAITERDGRRWFHTGDLGYHDENGFCYLVGRADELIVTAGYNVYPREVEFCLTDHPAVVEAAVVGVPDERRGETVKAFVVSTPGVSVTEAELVQHCLDTLAPYKHPRELEFVDELPRTDSGKVKRRSVGRR
ncbi:AMP-binding protein [Haladaptatus sp. YSMS36]|uniref:AMP-binding protein n=1 Tax=Haladaptatus sp. YSMS36 TaxID=3033384 RepID=UPI0023E85B5C|nr:AMP-binding protein [Haladaptatus sp. YSMS36]